MLFVFMFVLKRATKVNGSRHGKFIKISYSKRFGGLHEDKLHYYIVYSSSISSSSMRHFTQAITTTNACQNGSSNLLPLYMEQVVFPRIYREQSVHLSLSVCIELLIFTPGLCKVLTSITRAL